MSIKPLTVTILALCINLFFVPAFVQAARQGSIEETNEPKQEQRTKRKIYKNNARYDDAIDQLLVIASQADSEDEKILENIYSNLTTWLSSRKPLRDDRLEHDLRREEFMLVNYLLTELGHYEEIIKWHKSLFNSRLGIKQMHVQLATAYANIGEFDKAVEVMNQAQKMREVRRLNVLQYVHWAAEDYNQVINVTDKILGSSTDKRIEKQSLSTKYHAYQKLGDRVQADAVKEKIINLFGQVMIKEPVSFRFSSPILDHI